MTDRLARLIALADAAETGEIPTVDLTGLSRQQRYDILFDDRPAELDIVVLVEPITEDWGTPTGTVRRTVPAGTVGAIVSVYGDGSFEVEFPATTVRVTAGQIRTVGRSE